MVQDDPERRLDAWLDEALARYGDREPRAGLERRVLERVGAQKRGLPPWWKAWVPALATAAAVAIVTVVVVRNRDTSPETVTSETAPAQAPAAASEKSRGDQQREAAPGIPSLAEEKSGRPAGDEQTPETGTPASAPTRDGIPGPIGAGPHVVRGAGSASRGASSPRVGSLFPMPAPLSEQERLALAALRSGLLYGDRPAIPPPDEPLPEVVIQEIEIRPLQEIEPIGRNGS